VWADCGIRHSRRAAMESALVFKTGGHEIIDRPVQNQCYATSEPKSRVVDTICVSVGRGCPDVLNDSIFGVHRCHAHHFVGRVKKSLPFFAKSLEKIVTTYHLDASPAATGRSQGSPQAMPVRKQISQPESKNPSLINNEGRFFERNGLFSNVTSKTFLLQGGEDFLVIEVTRHRE